MTAYAFWNNKGGVGKSYLSFIAACEYAHRNKNSDVYVIDLCPQGNVSEMLLGAEMISERIEPLFAQEPRRTVAGYLESRLNSPFQTLPSVSDFVYSPFEVNDKIPQNLSLIAGDYFVEVLSEAMRQAAQLAIPLDAWRRVIFWIKDLVSALRINSGERDSIFIIDCNPSFAIYTQMAIAAADFIVVPFTADDSSRRAIENVAALVYGIGEARLSSYGKISFAEKAKSSSVSIPKIHTFVNNRVTKYEGEPSKAFKASSERVKSTVDDIYRKHRSIFVKGAGANIEFVEVPDYHSASIVSALMGLPMHRLKAGPKVIGDERVQINIGPLEKYKEALGHFVDRL